MKKYKTPIMKPIELKMAGVMQQQSQYNTLQLSPEDQGTKVEDLEVEEFKWGN